MAAVSVKRSIQKVTAAGTFGVSMQKGPLLLGSRYIRMVKKRYTVTAVSNKAEE